MEAQQNKREKKPEVAKQRCSKNTHTGKPSCGLQHMQQGQKRFLPNSFLGVE